MKNCIFCKIINNEIPNCLIFEDDFIKAFLDLSQTTKGHTLVVPKKHVENIFEYDEELSNHFFQNIPKIARAIKKSDTNIIGMNIINNNGKVAGQTVFHSHFHLIPRYQSNDLEIILPNHEDRYDTEKLNEIANKIKRNLKD